MTRKTAGQARLWLLILAFPGTSLVAGCGGTTRIEPNAGSEAGAAGVHLGSAGASGALPGGASSGGANSGGATPGGAGSGNHAGIGGASSGGAASGGHAGSLGAGTGGAAPSSGGAGHLGGTGNSAGAPSSAGSAGLSSGGGGASCVVGAGCKCGDLSGVVACGATGASCVCPSAQECQLLDDPKCFEPCGGDPFGGWVLEGSCFAAGTTSNGPCTTFTRATAGQNDVRMRILDGGGLDLSATEDWATTSRISLACGSVPSTNSCSGAFFYPDVTLFQSMPRATCSANACGACDCTDKTDGQTTIVNSPDSPFAWSKNGDTQLVLDGTPVSYCVQGEEMWIGGGMPGAPQAAYKFKKQSCVGTPVACASRTAANCQAGGDCTLGLCKATGTASALHCASASDPSGCAVLQGCTWDANLCFGDASPTCAFVTCGQQPGCSWGPPTERCGGSASCDNLNAADCTALGCYFDRCGVGDLYDVDCAQLSATDCSKAPGCVSTGKPATPCTGQTQCIAQTDLPTCLKLGCVDVGVASCAGDGTPCNQLSLSDCDKSPTCRHEW